MALGSSHLGSGLLVAALVVLSSRSAEAQPAEHEHPSTQHEAAAPSVVDLEMVRNVSGTAWQPESTPHAALHTEAAGFALMFHTLLFAGYDYQATDRGAQEPIAVGWLMGMAQRRFETSSLTVRLMLSPEPGTAGYRGGGYPLLLQTGETFGGQPLHDRQHPHDLFMEVGAVYTQGLGQALAVQLYAAPAGEPALGPVAYPHRYSASADPFATLAHHWQDATHITFGVLTAGLVTRVAKLEGSWFNGREPDERRYDFDLRRPDSYSVRLSLAPAPSTSAQVSYGYLASPETLRPGVPLHRATASITYDAKLGQAGHWATTAVYGGNKEKGEALTSSFVIEAIVDLNGRDTIFGRAEVVQKTGHDLVLTPALEESRFLVSNFGLGYLRNLFLPGRFLIGAAVRAAVGLIPGELEPFYGTRFPVGGMVYLRAVVAPMPAAGHVPHEGH
jgi:hypothetical protein